MTPRQRADMRKRQRADQEAERLKQAVVQNYNEGRKRFNEHRKRQVRRTSAVYILYTYEAILTCS